MCEELIDTEHKLMVLRWKGLRGLGDKGKGLRSIAV